MARWKGIQYGRGQDPNLVEYSFRRPVDYCSGVFLVTPRRLFESLGGFDQRYAPHTTKTRITA